MPQTKRSPGRHSSTFPLLVQRLLPAQWPDSDRIAWEAACQPARALRPAGAAAHLRSATRDMHAREWGCYLRYLASVDQLLAHETVRERLTPIRLGDYTVAIPKTNRASTIRSRMIQLSYVAAALVPGEDWSWIRRHPAVPTEAEANASRKEKAHCDPRGIIAKVLAQCERADDLADPLTAGVRYRDGVLLVFSFWSALRRKNLCSLKLGHSMFVTPDYIRIVFDEDAVKNSTIIDTRVPDFLCPYIRRYLDKHRPALLQGAFDTGAFWINENGKPLSYAALYGIFTSRSVSWIGQKLHPHSTRYSVASTLLKEDPLNLDIAADCLTHRGLATVERYYNQAGPSGASAVWQKLLERKTTPPE